MKLVQVKGNTWYLEGAALIPVYRLDETRCILFDSGWHWEREALKEVLDCERVIPVGVIATHAHRDHIGNISWLRQTYGTRIAMTVGEGALSRSPIMYQSHYRSLSLQMVRDEFGDAMFFRTDEFLPDTDDTFSFFGTPFRIHHTPGHSPEHVCIGTPDGVCYVGDLLLSIREIERAQLPYHLALSTAKASMERMRSMTDYSHFIIAHKGIVKDLSPTIDANLVRLDWVARRILECVDKPISWEELVRIVLQRTHLADRHGVMVASFENSIRSFIQDLIDTGLIFSWREWGTIMYCRQKGEPRDR